jgi:hypothetical protein
MLGPFDYLLWFLGPAIQAYIVTLVVVRRDSVRYFALAFYMLSAAVLSAARFFVFQTYGLRSDAYLYFYYYSDTLLTIFLYFAILGLYQRVFEEMGVTRQIRIGGNLLLVLTAIVSYTMVHQNASNMTKPFVVELSQNLYFVGVVLTYVLWGAVLQLRESRTRIVQLVLSLGIFFSAHAAFYAARHLFPQSAPWIGWLAPVMGLILPAAWAYTFTFVSEDARLATAHVAARRVAAAQVAEAHR